jgi:D-xylulose reductase
VTDGYGADVVYECSGDARAAAGVFGALAPGGTVVYVGIPLEPVAYDVAAAQIKEARVEHVFRYAHVFPRCVAMLASGAIDVAPLITRSFAFADAVAAFDLAASAPPGQVKMQIVLGD